MDFKRVAKLLKGQRGFTFIEVLIGVAIMGMIVAAFMMSLATAFKANMIAEVRTTADALARAQMEYVKAQPYSATYTIPPASISEWENKGYEVYCLNVSEEEEEDPVERIINQDNPTLTPPSALGYTEGMQQLTLLIKKAGETIITLEGLKSTR
ncbi:MAG: prepilin-type N-terminal cleavage/methylation domain-containing protein [Dehalococcoidales bacterium]